MCHMTGLGFDECDDLREIALCAALLPDFRERFLSAVFDIRPMEAASLSADSAARLPDLQHTAAEALVSGGLGLKPTAE